MPQIEIVTVGKPRAGWIGKGVEHYTKLLSKYRKVELSQVREAASTAENQRSVDVESERLAARFDPGRCNVVLDATGAQYSSEEFAQFLQQQESAGKPLQFFIGGAYGLNAEIKRNATALLSLSRFTLPHELSLVVLLEQLYRSYSLLAGGKYHK